VTQTIRTDNFNINFNDILYIERVCYLYATSYANQYITMLNISIPITRMLCYIMLRYVTLCYSKICHATLMLCYTRVTAGKQRSSFSR